MQSSRTGLAPERHPPFFGDNGGLGYRDETCGTRSGAAFVGSLLAIDVPLFVDDFESAPWHAGPTPRAVRCRQIPGQRLVPDLMPDRFRHSTSTPARPSR